MKSISMKETPPLLALLDAVPAGKLRDVTENLVLGVQRMGDGDCGLSAAPMQTIATPILQYDTSPLCDVWLANSPCRRDQIGSAQISYNDEILFGIIEVDETSFASDSPLRAATDAVYREIFALLDAKNYPHLWRIWNYIPAIHDEEAGLERYRQFNVGRQQAFDAARRAIDSSPAASALGTHGGLFSVAFIAGRIAPQRIENPRQVSAYDYPPQYGPRSPAFSRAAVIAAGQQRLLFVSGTASIVGHETVHDGDVAAQTRESVANIAALLQQANAASQSAITLQDLSYRVYVRHAHDAALVRQTLESSLTTPARVLYVQADVCRADLLVEIEAFAIAPLAAHPA